MQLEMNGFVRRDENRRRCLLIQSHAFVLHAAKPDAEMPCGPINELIAALKQQRSTHKGSIVIVDSARKALTLSPQKSDVCETDLANLQLSTMPRAFDGRTKVGHGGAR